MVERCIVVEDALVIVNLELKNSGNQRLVFTD